MTRAPVHPPIEVRGLVNRFGTQTVHDGLDLIVERGERVAIIGGSGSGKSVLMRSILGLQKPTGGDVSLFGVDPWTVSSRERREMCRRLGVLFQEGALFTSLTLSENIAFPLREHTHLPAATIAALCDVKLQLAGLPLSAAHKYPSELSGGMRKRAALARALALDPEILFLDEPTAGLDPIAAAYFDDLIVELAEAQNLTIFLITHDVDTVSAVATRVAVIGEGKIKASGTLDHIRSGATGWLAEYFSGPRARAAQVREQG